MHIMCRELGPSRKLVPRMRTSALLYGIYRNDSFADSAAYCR